MLRVSVALGLALGLATPAAAQDWWLGGAVGAGFQGISCDICRGGLDQGLTVRFAGGRTVAPHVLIGAQAQLWTDRADAVRTTFLSLGPALHWYPAAGARAYFLIGSLNYARYRAGAEDEEPVTSGALGMTFGGGWDVPLGGRLSMTPVFTMTATLLGELERDRTAIAPASFTLVQLAVGFGWR